ncbi:transcription-associated protein 1 [Pleurotus ostreatus]|nr:transcription-associated protein 1 [Pleurotus ostreatus]
MEAPSVADLERQAARIADPGVDLKTKHTLACEIQNMLDTIRESDSTRVLPQMIPAVLDLLRSTEVSFQKDSIEHNFRRVLLEIVYRLPINDVIRPHAVPISNCMLNVIRHDNEENSVNACKILIDSLRAYRILSEDFLNEFMSIFQQFFPRFQTLAQQYLSEESMQVDTNSLMPGSNSFKLFAEMSMTVMMFIQLHRVMCAPTVQVTMPLALEAVKIEAPAQKSTREQYEANGGHWSGMAPSIKNSQVYSDFVTAQVKMVSYLAYGMRMSGEQFDSYGPPMILAALRILQDCPAHAINIRKDLMVVFRHLMATPHRSALLSQIDKLLDEKVLLGPAISSREILRVNVYSATADLFHHLRSELSLPQLEKVIHVFSRLLHNTSFGNNLHTLFAKMLFNLIDVIVTKEPSQGAIRLLSLMFESCLERLEALAAIQVQIGLTQDRKKEGAEPPDIVAIERARPIGGSMPLVERPEDALPECRLFFRALLHGFRVCLSALRKLDDSAPDGTLIFRFFESCVRCMSLIEPDPRVSEQNDAIDWIAPVLLEINMHVFQEVWTQKIDFFFQCAQKRIVLLNICQFLLNREHTSPTLLAIILRYLMEKLPYLGDYDDLTAAATIRLFKMAFGAVGVHAASNEPILASHLAKLLMDCFPLAAKATKPTHYFHLLRALFRTIGGGGGRFELLFKEVLPLLPEMLENLNRHLLASDGPTRDMIVELCLTVPLRLTNLIPYLSYLMRPLALALKGSPELVSQGLRTLELCIDNLTPDFLDPTLNIVLRELMEALHSHLKPLPANHGTAHNTIRILGKLGGRNRRLLLKEPSLKTRHHSDSAKVVVTFGGEAGQMDVSAVSKLAVQALKRPVAHDRAMAYEFIENCSSILLHEGINGKNVQDTYVLLVQGLFDAIHISELAMQSEQFVRRLSLSIFDLEIRQNQNRSAASRHIPSVAFSAYLEALPHALATDNAEKSQKAQALITRIVNDLTGMTEEQNVTMQDVVVLLHLMAGRFAAMSLEDSWINKNASALGIKILTGAQSLGIKWLIDRQIEFVRALLHILKDLPPDLPRDYEEVLDVLRNVITICNSGMDFEGPGAKDSYTTIIQLVSFFIPSLSSSNTVVRQASQMCIELLAKICGKSVADIMLPHRERMLNGIYSKPLRALPYSVQIGMIEAVRYVVCLDPPVIEVNDEFLRLLHEALGFADAEDNSLINRANPRQSALEVTKLRVVCIKLLTASMGITDFFARQTQTRQRVTGVYFKSLYSSVTEIKDVAHDGLRVVLSYQARLPKELLQTGLRPILMNLADHKRLSVAGLEGLARLLELLTNYFKVEIGKKLLDHFRNVADPQMLQASSKLPLADNENIAKLVRLANIFHLLPQTANIFLEDLANAIVQVETQMHFYSQSPFSQPLAKLLDRFPVDGVDFMMKHLHFPRHLRTMRSIIQAKLAPNMERELASRTSTLVRYCTPGGDTKFLYPALLTLQDLAEVRPDWIAENEHVITALVSLWRADTSSSDSSVLVPLEVTQRYSTILAIFYKALDATPRVDLLFDVVSVFSRNWAMDVVHVKHFLYTHVASSNDLAFQRNVFARFMIWMGDPNLPWSEKAAFIRYVINPTLVVLSGRPEKKNGLLTSDFVNRMHHLVWVGTLSQDIDDSVKIELIHFTTLLVQHYSEMLDEARKDIIKWAWHHISTDDAIVKHTAYLLTARFFAVVQTPQKFILRTWSGLLRPPHTDGKTTIRAEALAALVPSLPQMEPGDTNFPQWALTTRRLLTEEGTTQLLATYQLIIKHPQLFYPVRALFVPHIVNSLTKLGLSPASSSDYRSLSIDILQCVYDWETQAVQEAAAQTEKSSAAKTWHTPLGFRENIVSYLVRVAMINDPTNKLVAPRALALLEKMVHPSGWSDVTVGLRYFLRSLEQIELTGDPALAQAVATAKILQVISAEQTDAWYTANANLLQKLVRKGMVTDDYNLHDALHPVFERLLRLYPLPKEDEEPQQGEIAEFHTYVQTSITNGLRETTALRGTLLMLKSVVTVTPERIEPFLVLVMKLLSKLAKEHLNAMPNATGYENGVRLMILVFDILTTSVAFLSEHRRWLLSSLVAVIEKSKSLTLCRYVLDLARVWAFRQQDAYPTMKEKASLLQQMTAFERRGEILCHPYLELIHEIYTDPSMRRGDLTTRLEQPFLLGCYARDPVLREKFIDLLDMSIPRSLQSRLTYIIGVQNWEGLAEHNWIYLAVILLLGASDLESGTFVERRSAVPSSPLLPRPKTQQLLRPLQRLLYLDHQVAHETWISIFPAAWSWLSRKEQADLTQHMVTLLSKDYHIRQSELRPNVIQTLLTSIHSCVPPMTLPPHLVKYLAKTYGVWHISLELLTASLDYIKEDEVTIRDYVYDSLADVYAELAEEDLFYGLWRRRSVHVDTNIALAFEQNGMWEQASLAYESAQTKARSGAIPFSESEYCLWEDHWMLAAEKLQHWEALYELAKSEANHELVLESAWRTKDWSENREAIEEEVNQLPEVPTPRRRVFETFIVLLRPQPVPEKQTEFMKLLEDAMQLSLRKWVALPSYLSAAHIPLLQHFQQFVELQEAVQIFGSLSFTNAQNLEKKSQELKMVLQAWRERLPNLHDDISVWSDLVAWRQNVFHAINKAYLPLVATSSTHGGSTSSNTYGFRGYHETAWIVNRFAHVARKHDLLEACFTLLGKIYTLPNIEITEAFLKLREEGRCHYQKPNNAQAGLEVINNTNLTYFNASQKAEFYTLKGMFHARFGRNEEANQAFGQAVQLDMGQPKAWAEWGKFNDRIFKEQPTEMPYAANAVSCYLQAAGSYKSGKSRPLLARVLWLLSIDDANLGISRAFDTYKGDAAYWYWITLIPQLCLSISHREVKQARYLLINIAKLYPQVRQSTCLADLCSFKSKALFYQLRTTREELVLMKKAAAARAAQQAGALAGNSAAQTPNAEPTQQSASTTSAQDASQANAATTPSTSFDPMTFPSRQASEHLEEVVQILKTAFPLLILSMETMIDQFHAKFKLSSEEETYRHIGLFLADAMQNYVVRVNAPDDEGKLNPHTIMSLGRMAQTLAPAVRTEFHQDFIASRPNHNEFIRKLQQWRDRYEALLDSRPRTQPMDVLSHYLAEFQYNKVDEVEIPGQYTEDKDTNQNFVRIQKFASKVENVRTSGQPWKRFTVHGSDGTKTSFFVQLPCTRHSRREERVMQILHTLSGALSRKKETRKRNLAFHLPATISCSPMLRLYQMDASYISLGDIYDLHCQETGIAREEPVLVSGDKTKKVLREMRLANAKPSKTEYLTLKKEIIDEIQLKMVPDDILSRYMTRIMDSPSDLWQMRKQFALHVASTSFMTYLLCIPGRTPSRFQVSRSTGLIAMTELSPGISNASPVFANNDAVPFRFTPNIQQFLGIVHIEGIFTSGLMAMGRSLTEPEFDLEQQLCLFGRDEVTAWLMARGRPWTVDAQFRQLVSLNIDGVVKRAETLACKIEREQAANNPSNPPNVPVIQTITNLISTATNPIQLMKMAELYNPWF